MKKLVYIITLLLLITGYSKAQMVIKGKVVDSDDGLPLPQVSVLISGTKKGVPTDTAGNFQITIAVGDELTFRFLGYISKTVKPTTNEFILIKLKPECILDHFGTNELYISPGYETINSMLGGKIEFSTTSIFRIWLETEQQVFWGNNGVSNYSGDYTILDIVHGCDFELEANFHFQSLSLQDFSFKNRVFSVRPEFNRLNLIVGFGSSTYVIENRENTQNGILLGTEKFFRIGKKYIEIEATSIVWGKYLELNAKGSYHPTRSLKVGVSYQHYRDFNSLSAFLGFYIRTRRLSEFEKELRAKKKIN